MRLILALYFLIVLCVSCVVAMQSLSANETRQAQFEELPLYLPVSTEQFPSISKELNAALKDADLGNIRVTTTDYWHPYQQGLRQGRRGVYFAAPHFSAWAIKQNKFVPILRLAGDLRYVIAARRVDSHIFEVRDLAGNTVCTQRAPNLDFLLTRSALADALILARTKNVSSVSQAMHNNKKDCDAFSVSEHIFNGFITEQPYLFIRLQHGATHSNYAFVLDRKTALEQGVSVKKFLLSSAAQKILQPVYKLYALTPMLVTTKSKDYSEKDYAVLKDYWY